MKLFALVGARPNFIKAAALEHAFRQHEKVNFKIIHTGQHSGQEMYSRFFEQLQLPGPHREITLHSKIPHRMTAQIIHEFGDLLLNEQPDAVVLVGDVNSTLAGAMAALKTGVPVAHVEAGLRCGDPKMPEESNRVLTDRIARWLFTTESSATDNLRKEGVPDTRVHFTGNVMIDSLLRYLPLSRAQKSLQTLGLQPKKYILCTIHRDFNIGNREALTKICEVLRQLASDFSVVFPVHPNTAFRLQKFGLMDALLQATGIRILPPQGYLEFLNLQENAALVITDSGGVQEESAFLQVPCLTYRPTTERP
ncbi:MAG TPA: UDP-N-acetylglucosamine 2-epimerase (non-hydrolyzing), partial [Saprospiraceae bacterium]|nr:UDP-N-acetylglucosamine 2-epimerase (non-hydrolyzing) [Saprospiraceae bacterium]